MSKILNISEIIYKRLYFGTTNVTSPPKSTTKHLYVTFDDTFSYPQILSCFGPSDLAIIFRYTKIMNTIMSTTNPKKMIVQCTSIKNKRKRANSAFLIGAYAVLVLGRSPEEAIEMLSSGDQPPYAQFCDTTINESSPILDLVYYYRGLLHAIYMGLFNFKQFNLNDYEFHSYKNGFMNWIVPNKFLAFPTPIETVTSNGCTAYIDYFKRMNIKTVIRLSEIVYNAHHFIRNKIDHYDLIFDDCTAPTMEQVREFLSICEKTNNAIAVHCKAGLGRTGTMIAAYMMKHYNFTALDAVGYIRLCRPGSIIGVQQKFLENNESQIVA